WSFRKHQSIIEYKAKLKGVKVVFVKPAHTSSLCPICGEKLSPNGHRVLKCENVGLQPTVMLSELEYPLKSLEDVGSSVPPKASR
ncbi:MAG: Transposase, partial [Candidatus Alkanophagales archaeon MCA70_species_2]|nr:Transposase [Candidatus Alkanophaga liquidiphilum]